MRGLYAKESIHRREIVGILKEADAGAKQNELCRRHGVSHETFYRWRKKYVGMEVPDARRLRQLEDENRALKRVVADQALNLQVLKDVLGKRGDDGAAADCRRLRSEVRRGERAARVSIS
jgi:putative transposase